MKEDKVALMAKVELLEGSVRALKEREKEARAELEGWLREEKSKENGVGDCITGILAFRLKLTTSSWTGRGESCRCR
jgi:hypothetical protein